MSEEEIIDKVSMIDQWKVSGDSYTQGELEAMGKLLELYYDNKKQLEQEKEKNKELEKKMGKDLDVVYMKATYDERDKWKDKIKEKMEEIMNYTYMSREERQQQNYAYDRLKELLEEK